MARNVAALTVGDLDDPDDDGSSLCTDDDSYIANSSLHQMVSSSLQMLDNLTKEVTEMSQNDGRPRIVTPTNKDDLRDMTIDVSFPEGDAECETVGSDIVNNRYSSGLERQKMAPKSNSACDRVVNTNSFGDEDDVSLDDSVANEMKLLKEVALEIEKELKCQDSRTVQEAIERIGNSSDPNIRGVLGSDDRDIIRRILDEEIKKKEPANIIGRYLYRCSMGNLNEVETFRFLVSVAVLVWSVVIALVIEVMYMDITLL